MASQLEHIQGLGALGFSHEEIKLILNEKPKNDYEIIEKGRLMGEIEFRRAMFDQAKAGSQAAIRVYLQMVQKTRKSLRAVDLPIDIEGFTIQELNVLDGLLMFRGNQTKACKYAGVNIRTYYNWLARETEHGRQFQNAARICKDMLDDAVEEVLMDKILVEGDPVLLQFYARTRLRHRGYTEKTIIGSTEDELAILPDGTVSEEGLKLVRTIEDERKMAEAVTAALKLLEATPVEEFEDAIDGEYIPSGDTAKPD